MEILSENVTQNSHTEIVKLLHLPDLVYGFCRLQSWFLISEVELAIGDIKEERAFEP